MTTLRRWLLGAAIVTLTQLTSQAGFVYVETSRGGTNGELSSDNLAPTVLAPMTIGVNSVTGQVTAIGSAGGNLTADIFTFQVPANSALQTIVLSSYSTQLPSVAMFVALDNGPTFQYSTAEMNDNINFPDLSLIMGGVVVGNNHAGTDILDDLANPVVNNNGIAFARPLGPGAYTMYIQETGAFSNYSLTFNVVTAVPEPSSVLLVAMIAVAAVPIAKYRKSKQSRELIDG